MSEAVAQLADIEDGNRPGLTKEDPEQLRDPKKRNRLLEQENEVLSRAAAFCPAHQPKMMYPLVRELAAGKIPVAVTCRVLGFKLAAALSAASSSSSSAEPRCSILLDPRREE